MMTPQSRPTFRMPQPSTPMVGFSQDLSLNIHVVDPGWTLPPCTPHSYPRLSLTSSLPHCTPVSPACHFWGVLGITGLHQPAAEPRWFRAHPPLFTRPPHLSFLDPGSRSQLAGVGSCACVWRSPMQRPEWEECGPWAWAELDSCPGPAT